MFRPSLWMRSRLHFFNTLMTRLIVRKEQKIGDFARAAVNDQVQTNENVSIVLCPGS